MIKKNLLIGSALTAFILIGCGGGSDTTTVASTTGYLVDSPVVNADYDCLGNNNHVTKQGKTVTKGAFTCQQGEHVRFRLGELVLGEITTVPSDGYVFPQDLVGVPRDGSLTDERVTALAQLLQSLDDDGNITENITIPDNIKTLLAEAEANFTASDLQTYLDSASIVPQRVRTQTQARDHLRNTMQTVLSTPTLGNTNGTGYGNHGQGLVDQNVTLIDPSTTPLSTLTPELKDALAYMGNEERLAYDVYTNLYSYHTNNRAELYQLYNIASAETTHIQTVQALVQKYNLGADDLSNVETALADNNVTVANMPSGHYDIEKIQTLYNALYAKGIQSPTDALQTACMVEVTDITDLNEYIELAKTSNASDIEQSFTALRDASYNHYWAFDTALKNLGVTEGCASAGAEYDHLEYPQNSHGNQGRGRP